MNAGKFHGPLSHWTGKIVCPVNAIGVREWEIRQEPEAPFFYEAFDGVLLIPQHEMFFDMGTIPRFLWAFFPPTEYPGPYAGHDCSYYFQYGYRARNMLGEDEMKLIAEAIFIEDEDERVCRMTQLLFERVPITRYAADGYLKEMVYKWSGDDARFKRNLVYAGVRVGGWLGWSRKEVKRNKQVLQDDVETASDV